MRKSLMPALAGVLIGILGQHLGYSLLQVSTTAFVTGVVMSVHVQLNK